MRKLLNGIDSLAGNEHAAMEAYQLALNHAQRAHHERLRNIQMNHEVTSLYLQSLSMDDFSCNREFVVWVMMSKALHSVEWMYGRQAALQILHECEKLAVLDYEQCLRDNGIPFKSRIIIVTRLIPQGCSHIKQLEQLITSSAQNSMVDDE